MTQKELHPTVIQFKDFVKKYPKMTQEVRKGTYTWQKLYEDWYLLGEEDHFWDQFKDETTVNETSRSTEEKKSDFVGQIFEYVKGMDINQIQQHINNFSQALGAVQGVLSQFQTSSQPPNSRQPNKPSNPFSFRKD